MLMCAVLPLPAHTSIAGLHAAGTLLVQSGNMQPLCVAALRSFGKILACIDQNTLAGEILSHSVWKLSSAQLPQLASNCRHVSANFGLGQ